MTSSATPAAMLDLSGRVIVVTGAGGGIGTGVVSRFQDAGATVVAATRSSPVSVEGITAVTADLTSEEGPTRVVERTLEVRGRIDGLVNNAGIQPVVPFGELVDTQWAEMIDVNLTATHRLTQAAAAAMSDGGSIVHIASIEAHHPTPVHGH